VRTKDSGKYHVLVNLWLILYKLTGWLASLDLREPCTEHILSHRKASRHALFDVLVLDRGRGQTMNDLVDRDRELPANKRDLTHVPDSGKLLIHHHHIFSKTGTASALSKSGMVVYQGGVHSVGVGIVIIVLGITNITSKIHRNNAT